MNKTSAKRRSRSACSVPRKRIRVEDTAPISRKLSVGDLSKNTVNPIVKRRNELFEAIHLRKSFKYVCKKHSVAYLVENIRREKKEASKERRSEMLESFRNLNLATNSLTSLEDFGMVAGADDQEDSEKNQVEEVDSVVGSCEDKISIPSESSTPEKAKDDEGIFFDAHIVSKLLTNRLDNDPKSDSFSAMRDANNNTSSLKRFSECQTINPGYITDDSDEEDEFSDHSEKSDEDMEQNEAYFSGLHFMKSLNVRKFRVNTNLPLNNNDDCIDSGLDEESNTCDCDYHEKLRQYFYHQEYESFSENEIDQSS